MATIEKSLKRRAALVLTAGAALAALNGGTAHAAEQAPAPPREAAVATQAGDQAAARTHCIRSWVITGRQGRRAFMENRCPNTTVYGQILWSRGGDSLRCRLLPYQRASSYRRFPAVAITAVEWHSRPPGARNNCT
jgi:hypothetical protein